MSGAKTVLFLLVLGVLKNQCAGYAGGAPESRCGTMNPGHWMSAQTTPCPYLIQLDTDDLKLESGDRLSINLTSPKDQSGFKGFLIQVKRPGESSNNVGSFDPFKSDSFQCQPVHCFGHENSALTHKDSGEKHFLHLVWIAPEVEMEDFFEIRATFVQNFWTIWPNQTPGKLIHVVKKKRQNSIRKENSTMPETSTNSSLLPITTILTSTTTSSTKPSSEPTTQPPMSTILLIPQVRNAETELKPAPNSSSHPGSKGSMNMEGSWEYFKTTWMNFLHYFGFK